MPEYDKKDLDEAVREAEHRVCCAVYETLDEIADEYWNENPSIETVRDRLAEVLAYAPEDA